MTPTELALSEMRQSYQEYHRAADLLDQKAGILLGSGSLVMALFSALQLTFLRPGLSWGYLAGLVLVVLSYLGLMLLTIGALRPQTFKLPVKADWDVLSEVFFTQDAKDSLLTLISGYVEQIDHNRQINDRKAARVQAASWLLGLIILALFVLSALPR